MKLPASDLTKILLNRRRKVKIDKDNRNRIGRRKQTDKETTAKRYKAV